MLKYYRITVWLQLIEFFMISNDTNYPNYTNLGYQKILSLIIEIEKRSLEARGLRSLSRLR